MKKQSNVEKMRKLNQQKKASTSKKSLNLLKKTITRKANQKLSNLQRQRKRQQNCMKLSAKNLEDFNRRQSQNNLQMNKNWRIDDDINKQRQEQTQNHNKGTCHQNQQTHSQLNSNNNSCGLHQQGYSSHNSNQAPTQINNNINIFSNNVNFYDFSSKNQSQKVPGQQNQQQQQMPVQNLFSMHKIGINSQNYHSQQTQNQKAPQFNKPNSPVSVYSINSQSEQLFEGSDEQDLMMIGIKVNNQNNLGSKQPSKDSFLSLNEDIFVTSAAGTNPLSAKRTNLQNLHRNFGGGQPFPCSLNQNYNQNEILNNFPQYNSSFNPSGSQLNSNNAFQTQTSASLIKSSSHVNRKCYPEEKSQNELDIQFLVKQQIDKPYNRIAQTLVKILIMKGQSPSQDVFFEGDRSCDLYKHIIDMPDIKRYQPFQLVNQLFIFKKTKGNSQLQNLELSTDQLTYNYDNEMYLIYIPQFDEVIIYQQYAKKANDVSFFQRDQKLSNKDILKKPLNYQIQYIIQETKSLEPAKFLEICDDQSENRIADFCENEQESLIMMPDPSRQIQQSPYNQNSNDSTKFGCFKEVKYNESNIMKTPFIDKSFKELVETLKKTENNLGPKNIAYDIEWKVRLFVVQVLMHAFRDQKLRIDGEIPITLFQKRVSPDLQIISNEKVDNKNQTLYIIELKKYANRTHNVNQNNQQLDLSLHQNFMQLRHHCIQHRQMKMLGILTNYKEWVFTKYSFEVEFQNSLNSMGSGGDFMSQIKSSDQKNPFEVSQKFTLMNENFELDVIQLQRIVNVLEWLAISFNNHQE
eukprot:403376960